MLLASNGRARVRFRAAPATTTATTMIDENDDADDNDDCADDALPKTSLTMTTTATKR